MKLIGYIRVSTDKQGESGLGLEAQLAAIHDYTARNAGELLTVYREVESGRKTDRPELAKAVAHAKRIKGRLVIGKLDRLARNVHFISGMMESGVDFVACDNPHASRLTLHILAAMAEHEAEMISQRTKAALAAAKARGVQLGSARPGHWQGKEDVRRAAALKGSQAAKASRDAQASGVYDAVRPTAKAMRDAGETLQAIANRLNADGHSTLRGLSWGPMQVSRLLA